MILIERATTAPIKRTMTPRNVAMNDICDPAEMDSDKPRLIEFTRMSAGPHDGSERWCGVGRSASPRTRPVWAEQLKDCEEPLSGAPIAGLPSHETKNGQPA